jgi:uncharacterized protein YfkK (UPF0435 family)
MPISPREFQRRIDDSNSEAMKVLYDFLASHRDLAYSRQELQRFAEQLPSPELRERFAVALETLVAVGAIEKRFVRTRGDDDYYAFAEDMDTSEWKPTVRQG